MSSTCLPTVVEQKREAIIFLTRLRDYLDRAFADVAALKQDVKSARGELRVLHKEVEALQTAVKSVVSEQAAMYLNGMTELLEERQRSLLRGQVVGAADGLKERCETYRRGTQAALTIAAHHDELSHAYKKVRAERGGALSQGPLAQTVVARLVAIEAQLDVFAADVARRGEEVADALAVALPNAVQRCDPGGDGAALVPPPAEGDDPDQERSGITISQETAASV